MTCQVVLNVLPLQQDLHFQHEHKRWLPDFYMHEKPGKVHYPAACTGPCMSCMFGMNSLQGHSLVVPFHIVPEYLKE